MSATTLPNSSVAVVTWSRKTEVYAISMPMVITILLNQYIIYCLLMYSATCSSYIHTILGVQWYWVVNDVDSVLVPAMMIGDVLSVTVSSLIVVPVSVMWNVIATSTDVIHSIASPGLFIKWDVTPGRVVSYSMLVEYAGIYAGQCSELCGSLHGYMPISITAV